MSPEKVTVDDCRALRERIYTSIFPRWALMLVILAVAAVMGLLYTMGGATQRTASDAQKKAEVVEATVNVEIKHLKEGIGEIKTEQKEQRAILHRIEKSVNGD